MFRIARILLLGFIFVAGVVNPQPARSETIVSYLVHPGDTWASLAYRLGIEERELIEQQNVVNPKRQPVVGGTLSLHETPYVSGKLIRVKAGGLLESAAGERRSPWALTLQNEAAHPFLPVLYDLLSIANQTEIPRELPVGFIRVSLSELEARPGEAIAVLGQLVGDFVPEVSLGGNPWLTHMNQDRLIALGAVHAFFGDGAPELLITANGEPAWSQPLLVTDKEWQYDRVNFPASATTDPQILEQERKRLRVLWGEVTPEPLWSSEFALPLPEYVALTSQFGARRSVNGGPFNTYHEGTDFSAFRGTEVLAPAGGQVVLAEPLLVRGGTVIIDHGLGIHSGYYHLSKITVATGDRVVKGSIIGQVGSTGRSTGNHLHWDFLIGTTWVDPQYWAESNLGTGILSWWGAPMPQPSPQHRSGSYLDAK